uniref:Uncharacterized protein n=1 Tax=Amphimedon queenslandica TaxID=400682 RepID=A0A1X7USZ9_AMPQE
MSSEKKQRDVMKNDLEPVKIIAEAVPFSFTTRHGSQEIKPAPLACVDDLESVIIHLLDEKKRLNQLTWHDGVIPPNEIWIELGGDKGGSSERAIIQHQRQVSKGFEKDEGLFVKSLDNALASFNVIRQAYHGGSFIGNHIHRALKPHNIRTLCSAIMTTADSLSRKDVELKGRAGEICTKYTDMFSLLEHVMKYMTAIDC